MRPPNRAMTSSDGDEAAAQRDTLSAGEVGSADAESLTEADVVIGEIPAAQDPTAMLWTARCSEPAHDLLGQFETREAAETAREEHLESAHGGATT